MDAGLKLDVRRVLPSGFEVAARLSLPPGPGITALFGPSGSGKSTLLRCIAGLDRPRSGSIAFGEEVWFDAAQRIDVPAHKRHIGYVTQDDALFPHLTVRENLAYAASSSEAIAASLGITEVMDRRPAQISGGQRQRVALARALVSGPRLVLLDEPLSALDVPSREQVRLELRRLLAGLAAPAIVVTHDRADVLALADRVVVIADGRILQEGTVIEVFGKPADGQTARLVGIDTICEGVIVSEDRGLARVQIGSAILTAVSGANSGPVLVCIRGEDVVLQRRTAEGDSPRNHFVARVLWIREEGALVRVGLDCGFALAASVTRPAVEDLSIKVGSDVIAAIKATAIHLVPR